MPIRHPNGIWVPSFWPPFISVVARATNPRNALTVGSAGSRHSLPAPLAIASVKVCCLCRTRCVPPQTKHTARGHLEDCPGSLWLAMGVVDGEAGLG
jgi:hypothetical protein